MNCKKVLIGVLKSKYSEEMSNKVFKCLNKEMLPIKYWVITLNLPLIFNVALSSSPKSLCSVLSF